MNLVPLLVVVRKCICFFFCYFSCSRSHNISMDDSCTLLFPGMYSHFEFDQSMHDEYDTGKLVYFMLQSARCVARGASIGMHSPDE